MAPNHELDMAAIPPVWSVTVWPHRSLSPQAFRIFLGIIAALLMVPLVTVIGTMAAWVIGGFLLADLLLLYGFMQLTYRSGRVREVVQLWPDRLRVDRYEPNGSTKSWEANPHWVHVKLIPTKRVEDYLVLSSAGRDVELGAFLTPTERRDLADALRREIAAL